MTTPDIAGLCERLRADTPVHNRGPDYAPIMVAPGPLRPEAADTIERQAAEIKRLRAVESSSSSGLLGFTPRAVAFTDPKPLECSVTSYYIPGQIKVSKEKYIESMRKMLKDVPIERYTFLSETKPGEQELVPSEIVKDKRLKLYPSNPKAPPPKQREV
jgi:hypothetical protein